MELYQLKTFVAIAQEGSVTRAAERVFTSAPAVSAQLKALEDELGVKLFERTPRGMELSAAGSQLLEEAQRTLASASRLRSAAEQIRASAQGEVRFGTVVDPVSLRLGEVLVKLAEQHPHLQLQLRQGLSFQTLQAVQRGELDCAYMLSDLAQIEGMELVRLSRVELAVVLPNAMRAKAATLSLQALTALPWVGTAPSCVLRRHLDALFDAAGAELKPGPAADGEAALRSMVASGMGAGLIRRDQAELAQRAGEAVIWEGWSSHTWLCWVAPASAQPSAAVAAVREAVLDSWADR